MDALKEEIAGLEEQVAAHEETIKGLVADEEAAGDAVEAASEAFNMADNECVVAGFLLLLFSLILYLYWWSKGVFEHTLPRQLGVLMLFLLLVPIFSPQTAEEKGQA